MKISFVIPAYNEAKNIVSCVESIQKEIATTTVPCEIIVVNNNSTDETKELAENAGAKVVDEHTKGIVWARRAGVAASTGDIIASIDADNRLPQGWLTTVIDNFSRDEKLVALSGPLIYYDVSAYIRAWTKFFYIFGYTVNEISNIFGKGAMLQGGNYVMRKDSFLRSGGYDTTISFYGEDVDTGKKLSKMGKVKWTFVLPIFSSGRRIEKEGLFVMGVKYGINYVWIVCTGHPFSKTYIDVRK